MRVDARIIRVTNNKRTTMTVMPTRMEPSSGWGVSQDNDDKRSTSRTGTELSASALDYGSNDENPVSATTTTENGNASSNVSTLVEEDLFAIPPDLNATYRPLDWLTQSLVLGVMGNIALIWDATRKSQKIRNAFHLMFRKGPVVGLTEILLECQRASWNTTWQWFRWLAGFLFRCAVLTTFTTMILQDLFLRPTRITAENLKNDYTLPSTLSKFEQIPVIGHNVSTTVCLHWLEYRNDAPSATPGTPQKRILYCNHGFGASSLSWLPILKRMTHQLKCQLGLAHDALGFGFSEPPTENSPPDPTSLYSSEGSASLAKSLLQRYLLGQNDTVTLVGHSMGALTTLRMALALPKEIEKRIILVAPALGIRQTPTAIAKKSKFNAPWKAARPWLLERPFQYVLRRAVGRPGFWRSGLKIAWGDANRLRDTDVLRFQWPSIHKGWESGLVRFARAQTQAFSDDGMGLIPDEELLIRVLALPKTKVEVILGENDRVVASERIRRFLEPFPRIPIQEISGAGHDPFEEDVDAFLRAIG